MTDQVRKQTFLLLYEPVHLSFQRFCRARTDSEDDAKDLIGETVLKAYEGIHRLRDEKAFLGFLFGIASRLIKKNYRRKKFWSIFDLDKSKFIKDKSSSPEQDLDVQFLYDALQKLPLKYQEAVTLHYISGFSIQEVASIQGSTLSAVKVRILRGKRMLREALGILETNHQAAKNVVSLKVTE